MDIKVTIKIVVLFSMVCAAVSAPVSGDGYDIPWSSYTTKSTTTESWGIWNNDFDSDLYSLTTVPYYYFTTWSYYTETYTYTYYSSSGSGTVYYAGGGGGFALIVGIIICCRAGAKRRQQRPMMRVRAPPNPNRRVPGAAIPVASVAVAKTGTPAGQFNRAFNHCAPQSPVPNGAPPSYNDAVTGSSSQSTLGATAPPSVEPQVANPQPITQNTDRDNLVSQDAIAIETTTTTFEEPSTSVVAVSTSTTEAATNINETTAVKNMAPIPEQDPTSRDSVCLLEYDQNNIPEKDEAKEKSTF